MSIPNFLRVTRLTIDRYSLETAGASAPISGSIALSVQSQQQANWCWAAVSTSVSLFYDPSSHWTQCTVANATLPRADCCGAGASDFTKCNIPWYLDRALRTTGNLAGVDARALAFDEIKSEIARGAPIGSRIGWFGGGGHFVTIVGWLVATDGSKYVSISDPIYLNSQIAFSAFAKGYQSGGDWTHSYRTAPPQPSGAAVFAELAENRHEALGA